MEIWTILNWSENIVRTIAGQFLMYQSKKNTEFAEVPYKTLLKILFSFHLTSRILLPFLGSGCSTKQREYRNLRNTNEYAKRVQWIYCRESWIHFSTFGNKGYSKRNNQLGWIPIYSSRQKKQLLLLRQKCPLQCLQVQKTVR